MKILGFSIAVLFAIGAGLYVAFFLNLQTREQEEINAAWTRFGEDIAALGEVVQGAPFNRDEQTDEGLWEVLNLTTLGQGAPRPAPTTIAAQLDNAVAQVRNLRELLTVAHRITFQLTLDPNEVSEPAVTDPNIPMADPFQAASRGYFRLADLDDHVPAGAPRVTPEERAQVIAARQAAISRRFAGGS